MLSWQCCGKLPTLSEAVVHLGVGDLANTMLWPRTASSDSSSFRNGAFVRQFRTPHLQRRRPSRSAVVRALHTPIAPRQTVIRSVACNPGRNHTVASTPPLRRAPRLPTNYSLQARAT